MKKKAIIVDINGTLSEVSDIVHFIKEKPKDWDSFFDKMNDAKPNAMVKEFVKALGKDYEIVLVSGSPEKFKKETVNWLSKNQIVFDEIHFRSNDDKKRGFQFKKSLFEDDLKEKYNVILVLDDKQDACEMWRSLGLDCWHVGKDEEKIVVTERERNRQREMERRMNYRRGLTIPKEA